MLRASVSTWHVLRNTLLAKFLELGDLCPLVLGDSFQWDVGHRCVENEQVCGRNELFKEGVSCLSSFMLGMQCVCDVNTNTCLGPRADD